MKLLPAPKSIFERFHYGVDFGMPPDRMILTANFNLTNEDIKNVLDIKLVRIDNEVWEIPEYQIQHLKNILLNRSFGFICDHKPVHLELVKKEDT